MIYSITVKPDAQRKGYGTTLLDFADQRAIELGLHQVRLYTNERMERNLRLYRRHGFVEVGTRPWAGARRYGSETGTGCVHDEFLIWPFSCAGPMFALFRLAAGASVFSVARIVLPDGGTG
jgi:ribosomal protein S18 acetylase RimI-like enzyme